MALAMAAAASGLSAKFSLPERTSDEKVRAARRGGRAAAAGLSPPISPPTDRLAPTHLRPQIDMMNLFGAHALRCPPVPLEHEKHYYSTARRWGQLPGHVWTDQFENTTNSQAHFESEGLLAPIPRLSRRRPLAGSTAAFDSCALNLSMLATGPEIYEQTNGQLDAFVCASASPGGRGSPGAVACHTTNAGHTPPFGWLQQVARAARSAASRATSRR